MMGNQKGFSIVFAMATLLLSFNTVSSLSILPRITRTDDAIVLDFSDQEYYGPYQQVKNLNSELAYPGFIPVPAAFNPYAVAQPKFYDNGWSYFYGYPSLVAPAAANSQRQFEGEDEEVATGPATGRATGPAAGPAVGPAAGPAVQVAPAPAPSPAPAPAPAPAPNPVPVMCGTGPSIFPTARQSLASERVTGGGAVTAKKGAWPFMVGLRKAGAARIYCTGTLISNSKVLLAAQCLEQLSVFEISGVTVLIGSHLPDLTDVSMTRRISKVIIHSHYNAATYANDIAVIILDSPVTLSKTVAPVCLPPPSTDPDQYLDRPALILGWGDSNRAGVGILRQGLVAISSNENCKQETIFGKFVSDNSTCVTSPTNNKFTCVFDIGGPVVINTAPPTVGTPAIYTIVGINSYTTLTEECNSNGLKTRVSAYKDWIDKAN